MNATNNGGLTKPNAPRKRTPQPITAAEALQLLESAVNYCQAAGLAVRAGNVPNLCLSIDGAMMQGDPPRFIVALPEVESALAEVGTAPTPPARPMRSRL